MPGTSQASDEADAPVAAITSDLFLARFWAMFTLSALGPIAIRTPLLASGVMTKKYV